MRLKRKVIELVKDCELIFNEIDTSVDLNILPLGSYDILIGMDWLESHKTIINCLHKSFDYINEKGNYHTIKGVCRHVSIRKISVGKRRWKFVILI